MEEKNTNGLFNADNNLTDDINAVVENTTDNIEGILEVSEDKDEDTAELVEDISSSDTDLSNIETDNSSSKNELESDVILKQGIDAVDDVEIDLFSAYTFKDKRWWDKYKIGISVFSALSLITLCVAAVIFFQWHFTGTYTDNLGDEIVSQVTSVTTTAITTTKPYIKDFEGNEILIEDIEIKVPEEVELLEDKFEPLIIDFEELKSKYPNAVAWIEIPGIELKYPVAQTTDNEYYLTHSIDGTLSKAGWVFADYRMDFEVLPQNMLIFGHNMADGTIFGKLKRTQYEEWWSNPDNQYIYFVTEYSSCVYQVFNIFTADSQKVNYARRDLTANNIREYLTEMQSLNILKEELTYANKFKMNDKIITLSTCNDAQGAYKYVVQGILVYEEEIKDNGLQEIVVE